MLLAGTVEERGARPAVSAAAAAAVADWASAAIWGTAGAATEGEGAVVAAKRARCKLG